MAAWLVALLLLVSTPLAEAKPLTISDVKRVFPYSKTYKINGYPVGMTLCLEGYSCVLLPDISQAVRYIIVLSSEKSNRSPALMQMTRPTAERLTKYITQEFCQAKLVPFADGESGYVIVIGSPSFVNHSSSVVGLSSVAVIDRLLDEGGSFYYFGVHSGVTLRMPGPFSKNGSSYVTFSPISDNLDLFTLDLERSARESDRKVAQAADMLLKVDSLYSSANMGGAPASSSTGRSVALCSRDCAIAECNERYYVGKKQVVNERVWYVSRDVFIRSGLRFPQASSPVPKTAKAAQEEQAEMEKIRIAKRGASVTGLCGYFGCDKPVVKSLHNYKSNRCEDCEIAHLQLRGCQVVIPVPSKLGADLQTRMSLPFRIFYIRSNDGNPQKGVKLADGLVQMANLGKSDTTVDENLGVVKVTVEDGTAPRYDIFPDRFDKIFTGRDFADKQTHDWPNTTVMGRAVPEELKEVLGTVTDEPQPLHYPDPSRTPKHLSADDALAGYIAYLRRLME